MMSRTHRMVVRRLPTSTTNMTGFFATCAGVSLRKLSPMAGPRMVLSNSESCRVVTVAMSVDLALLSEEVLDDGAEREGGEEGESADDDDDAREQACEERPVGGEGAWTGRSDLLVHHAAGDRHDRDDHEEAAEEHRDGSRDVVEGVAREAGEGRAVVARLAREGVERFAQPVRAGVVETSGAVRHDERPGREAEDDEREDEHVEH